MNAFRRLTLLSFLVRLKLLTSNLFEAKYLNSKFYESEHGQITAVALDTTSGDLVLSTTNSTIRLNLDLQTETSLSSITEASIIDFFHVENETFTFICSSLKELCYFLVNNNTTTIPSADTGEMVNFPWTDDGTNTIFLHQNKEEQMTNLGDTSLLFVINNVVRNYKVSSVFSVWNVSFVPPRIYREATGISVLNVVSPHTFQVITGFSYKQHLYYVVRINPLITPAFTNILQINLSDPVRVLTTRFRCESSSVGDITAYYDGSSPEMLYVLSENNGSQSVCSFQMADLEQYFQKVLKDCKGKQKGSRIIWLEESSRNEKRNPCYKYAVSSEHDYPEAIFAASTLSPTMTIRLPPLAYIDSFVVYRTNNLTLAFVADRPGNISKILLDVPSTLLYSTALKVDTERRERSKTELKIYRSKLYAIRGNTIQYIDFVSCSIHKLSINCLRDVTSCTWCSVDQSKTPLFACVSQETCTQPKGYLGPSPTVDRFEPSTGPISGGVILTIHGMNLDMVVNRNVTINNSPCDIIKNSVSSTRFNCIVPKLLSDNTNLTSYLAPVQVTLDSTSFNPIPSNFTYLADPFLKSYTPWTTIASGGTKIIISGSNLNLLNHVKLSYFQGSERISRGESSCYYDEDTLTCITPSLFVDEDQLPLNVSLRLSASDVMDDSSELFYSLSSELWSTVFKDPIIYGFIHEARLVDYIDIEINSPELIIYGSEFDSLSKEDLNISIFPLYTCEPQNVSESRIVCTFIGSIIRSLMYESVTVQIGLNLLFYPGFVSFYDSKESALPETDNNVGLTETQITSRTSAISKINKNKTMTIRNSTDTITLLDPSKEIINGKSTIYSDPNIAAASSITSGKAPFLTSSADRNGGERYSASNPVTQIDNGSDVKVIATVLCTLTLMIVALIAFRKQLAVKIKIILRSRSRSDDDSSDASDVDHDGVLHSVESAGVTYSLRSLGGYTAETVLSVDEDEDDSLQIFYERFEDTNLLVKRDQITMETIIGQGNFGSVFKGVLTQKDHKTVVAIKTIHKNDNKDLSIKAFLKEAYVMKHFHHENVLELLGVCFDDDKNPLALLPFMPHGDLLNYLHDDSNIPTVKDLVCFGLDIANGMEYLAKLKFVHRDLAARNCMLDSFYHVKVADFGLSRDIYETAYYSTEKRGKLPVKWMAPESLATGVFDEKTDVWAFGVTLWELMTRGVRPYAAVDNWDIEKYLRSGRRLPQPLFCPTHLYKMMRKCWEENPADRPTFTTLKDWIATLLDRVEQPLGDKDRATNIATVYVNLAMGSQYKHDADWED